MKDFLKDIWYLFLDLFACFCVDVHNFFLKFRRKSKPTDFNEADIYHSEKNNQ